MKKNNSRRLAAASSIGGILFGYDTGVISGAILFIRKDFALSYLGIELIVSAVLIGAILGAGIAGVLTDKFGRRKVLTYVAALFVIATLGAAFSRDVLELGVSRFLIGVSIGLSSMIVPLYIAEIAHPKDRGRLVTYNQLVITIGIVLAYLVSYFLTSSESWRWMLGLGAIPAVLFFICLLFLPESPRWLIKAGRLEEAKHVLYSIFSNQEAHDEFEDIKQSVHQPNLKHRNFQGPYVKKMLVVGIGLAIFQQITGINTIIYYAPMIFEFTGLVDPSHAIFATLILGVINVLSTIGSLYLLDSLGRRPLLLTGIAGMCFSLAALGFLFHSSIALQHHPLLALASLIVYVISFAIGLGPIFWLLISEIYPLEVRGRAMSIATVANWASNAVVVATFLTIIDHLGKDWVFWIYGLFSVLAWLFAYFLVPETKNKTLEELSENMI